MTVPKIALLIAFIQIVNISFFTLIDKWQPILIISSILSIIIGTFGALYQIRIKRFFAYSTISNIGFILMGLSTGSIEGIESSILYTLFYVITNLGLFMIILGFNKSDNFKMSDLKGIAKNSQGQLLAISFSLLLFSTAGLPPLAGFIGKLQVLFSALNESLYLLVFIGIIFSVISTAYYIRLIQYMFFQDTETNILNNFEVSKFNSIFCGLSLILICTLLIIPQPIIMFCHELTLKLCF